MCEWEEKRKPPLYGTSEPPQIVLTAQPGAVNLGRLNVCGALLFMRVRGRLLVLFARKFLQMLPQMRVFCDGLLIQLV